MLVLAGLLGMAVVGTGCASMYRMHSGLKRGRGGIWRTLNRNTPSKTPKGRIFISKAVMMNLSGQTD